jgi:hypothetical protein
MTSNSRCLLSTGLLLAMALYTVGSAAQVAPGSEHHARIAYMRGMNPNAAGATTNPQNMSYFGGALLPSTTTYAFWWGKPSDFPSDARDGLDDFLDGLDASPFLDVADQYLFGQKARTRFGGNLFDYSAPPLQPVDLTTGFFSLAPEICKVLSANGQTPDPKGLYIIYTSNFPNENLYCAFHGYDTCADGTVLDIIYVPNFTSTLSSVSGCGSDFDPLFSPNKHSEATRAMASATAHEFMESITDPNGDGWTNATTGDEVADPCVYLYQSWVPVTDDRWKLQEIWSNQAGGCAQGSGRNARVLGATSHAGAITTFDIPTATNGIFAQGINIFGAVAGDFVDANNSYHGFVRDVHGNITTFDSPGAANSVTLSGTFANSINDQGTAAGLFVDSNFVNHGFVRDSRGNFTTIDAPGAASATNVQSINAVGAVAGYYVDANSVSHGFVRTSMGDFLTFDAPGANTLLDGGTTALSINAIGGVAGNYLDANSISHGFVRHANGTIATFDAPGANQGTYAQSINDLGVIVGYYTDAQFVSHGFVRGPLGNITTFDDPYATSGTFAYSINANGSVAGYYTDANGFPQGFVRDKYGSFFAITAPGTNYGNVVRSINDVGATAGYETKATF